jgi:predicted tellurium resistance membrane protein TerC
MNFEWITQPHAWLTLVTLTVLEIVLGVDNIIFISILAGKLPPEKQDRARKIGLLLALVTRLILLSLIFVLASFEKPLFHVPIVDHAMTGRDLVLFIGGLFLLWKSVHEIHGTLEDEEHGMPPRVAPTMAAVIGQIVVIDIVFSLDSVITAIGMAEKLLMVMMLAVIIALGVMLLASKSISDFVNRHPTVKMLALSFLLLVGFVLIADGLGQHVPKGYIYFAMAFSFGVEMLNIKIRKKKQTVPDVRNE